MGSSEDIRSPDIDSRFVVGYCSLHTTTMIQGAVLHCMWLFSFTLLPALYVDANACSVICINTADTEALVISLLML